MIVILKRIFFPFSLLLYSLLIVVMGAVPPVSRDALTHHLAVPKLYLKYGGIIELPHIRPSYYPQLLDFLYCIPMYFGNDTIPKIIHFSFALLTARLIYGYLKHRLGRPYAYAGCIFFLTLPVIIKLSVTVYVDLGLVFFSTAALMSLLKWKDCAGEVRWLILSATCCGLSLGTKYNGLITFFLLTALTSWISARNTWKKKHGQNRFNFTPVIHCFIYLSIALAVFSPWVVKNYKWTQNPLYPLLNTYFTPSPIPDLDTPIKFPKMHPFLIRKLVYKENFFETITVPVRIFFQGKDDNPKLFDGRLNPLLCLLPIFAFFFRPRSDTDGHSNNNLILLSFSLLYILMVFFYNDMRLRWIGPAIPPLVILSAYGFHHLFSKCATIQKRGLLVQRTFILGVLLIGGMNLVYLAQLFWKIDPLPYLTGKLPREAYIEKFRPEFPAFEFANSQLKGNVKFYGFFLGGRLYYLDHEIRFNHDIFKKIVMDSQTPQQIRNYLFENKITGLILNIPAFENWANKQFKNNDKLKIKSFLRRYTQLLFLKNNHGVYALL